MKKTLGIVAICLSVICEGQDPATQTLSKSNQSDASAPILTPSPILQAVTDQPPVLAPVKVAPKSIIITDPVVQGTVSGTNYSLTIYSWNLSDQERLSEVCLLSATLSGPPLPSNFFVIWYVQIAQAGQLHKELESFTFEIEINDNRINSMEITNYKAPHYTENFRFNEENIVNITVKQDDGTSTTLNKRVAELAPDQICGAAINVDNDGIPDCSPYVQTEQDSQVWLKAADKHQSLEVTDAAVTLKMTAYRLMNSNTNFNLQKNTSYQVLTGFKIFASQYASSRIDASDSNSISIMWASAARLAYTGSMIAAIFLF